MSIATLTAPAPKSTKARRSTRLPRLADGWSGACRFIVRNALDSVMMGETLDRSHLLLGASNLGFDGDYSTAEILQAFLDAMRFSGLE